MLSPWFPHSSKPLLPSSIWSRRFCLSEKFSLHPKSVSGGLSTLDVLQGLGDTSRCVHLLHQVDVLLT